MKYRQLLEETFRNANGPVLPISKETRKFHRSGEALIAERAIGKSYTAERVIGNGGLSVVYEATYKKTGEKVAVKIYNENDGLGLVGPKYILAKASAVAKINHPQLVKVLDMGIHEGRAFVVMELLSGITLQGYIENCSPPPSWKTAKGIMLQVCCGLDGLHKAGIVHMDVKPSNIFLAEGRAAKVFDFDISFARFLEEPKLFSLFIGSEHYASPEQFNGIRRFDPRIDIYSVGIVMYELATGRHPFPGDDMAELFMMHTEKLPEPPRSINPALPEQAAAVIMKALEKRPENRFQNMQELILALLEA